MASKSVLQTAGALAIAATVAGIGSTAALAQDYLGSAVTVGGGTTGVDVGDIVVLAPGVTISGGDVSNQTGIGVIIGGGSSIGAAAGGGTNATIVE